MKKDDISFFELSGKQKVLLARTSNFFHACSTHGDEYFFMDGVIPEEVYRRNMSATQEISGEAERLNELQGAYDSRVWD